MSGEFLLSKQIPIKKQEPTDFATPSLNQQILGLDSDMGGVLAFKNEEILPSKEFVALISRLAELKTAELSRDLFDQEVTEISNAELKLWNNISLEDLEMFILEIQILRQKQQKLDNSSPAKFVRFIDNQVNNSPTVKFGKNIWQKFDNHLNGNTVGNKLADSIQATTNKYQAEKRKSAKISAEFKETVETEQDLEKGRKLPINPNLLFAGLGFAGLVMATGLLLGTSSPKLTQTEQLSFPTPTDENRQTDGQTGDKIIFENPNLTIQQQIIKSDLTIAIDNLDSAQSYLENYLVISQSDKDSFSRELIAYRAKLANLIEKIKNLSPANINQISEESLETYRQVYILQQIFENINSRETLPTGSFGKYVETIPKTTQEKINLRAKFGKSLEITSKNLQTVTAKKLITVQQSMQIREELFMLTGLARYNDKKDTEDANRKILEINEQIISLFDKNKSNQEIRNLTIPKVPTPKQPVPKPEPIQTNL